MPVIRLKEQVMDEAQRDQIKQIIGDMQCPKNFVCAESGFEKLCKTKDIGMESLLECFEDNPWLCRFSIPFGKHFFLPMPATRISGKES